MSESVEDVERRLKFERYKTTVKTIQVNDWSIPKDFAAALAPALDELNRRYHLRGVVIDKPPRAPLFTLPKDTLDDDVKVMTLRYCLMAGPVVTAHASAFRWIK